MHIKSAEFIKSSPNAKSCPETDLPEYAFVGRSNVGKSSLINLLTGRRNIAKTSSTPGKTQLINHFLINNEWYLVDLPGLGYARASKSEKSGWEKTIVQYILLRKNLRHTFVLVDVRHDPQNADINIMTGLASARKEFSVVFTKTDKLTRNELRIKTSSYHKILKNTLSVSPVFFYSSALKKTGRDEILDHISALNIQ